MGYDVVGDVHGHADQLEALLTTLGYRHRQGAWRHANRKVVFVGDLIDRGPDQLATLELVRDMVDEGSALAVMENHEFNAIGWHTDHPKKNGDHLRTHLGAKGAKNRLQHGVFLEEVGENSLRHREWVAWLSQLPLWIEEPEFRVVHACWSPKHVELLRVHLRDGLYLSSKVLEDGSQAGNDLYEAVETLLKGVEVKLPPNVTFYDKENHPRDAIRTRWWNPSLRTFREAYIGPPGVDIPDDPIPNYETLPEPDRPTFIGHYWLDPTAPLEPVADRVACLDYSVANGGPLVAYRFDGETSLSAEKFASIRA
jgi:hypothetical protein